MRKEDSKGKNRGKERERGWEEDDRKECRSNASAGTKLAYTAHTQARTWTDREEETLTSAKKGQNERTEPSLEAC